MSGLNTEWALKELDALIHVTELVPHPSPNVIGSFPRGSKKILPRKRRSWSRYWIEFFHAGESKFRTMSTQRGLDIVRLQRARVRS